MILCLCSLFLVYCMAVTAVLVCYIYILVRCSGFYCDFRLVLSCNRSLTSLIPFCSFFLCYTFNPAPSYVCIYALTDFFVYSWNLGCINSSNSHFCKHISKEKSTLMLPYPVKKSLPAVKSNYFAWIPFSFCLVYRVVTISLMGVC